MDNKRLKNKCGKSAVSSALQNRVIVLFEVRTSGMTVVGIENGQGACPVGSCSLAGHSSSMARRNICGVTLARRPLRR